MYMRTSAFHSGYGTDFSLSLLCMLVPFCIFPSMAVLSSLLGTCKRSQQHEQPQRQYELQGGLNLSLLVQLRYAFFFYHETNMKLLCSLYEKWPCKIHLSESKLTNYRIEIKTYARCFFNPFKTFFQLRLIDGI